MTRPPTGSRRIPGQHPIGGAQQGGQADVNQIDAGHPERQIAVGHHTFVEQAIQEVEQRGFGRFEQAVGLGRFYRDHLASCHDVSP
jgi:hypothetical protein